MRKSQLFSAVLSLFLLVPASITRAQTISSQKGLTTAVFSTQYGNVKIYLPDDIRPGEMISGTVIAEPKGNNARQTEKNLAELLRYSISVNGNKSIVSSKPEIFKSTIPPNMATPVPIDMLDPGGNRAQLIVPLKTENTPTVSQGCAIPTHALVGEPARIKGSFDGDMSNTQCLISNQPAEILAESSTGCFVRFPQNARGEQSMQVKENGEEKCTRQISGVDMQITTGKLNLKKGESTYIEVKLTGLQNLPDTAVLTITNITPGVVAMTNGNVQVIPIPPIARLETFSVRSTAVSIATGDFQVMVNLDLPEAQNIQADIKPLPARRELEKEAILFGLSKAWKDAYTDMVGSGTRNELENCEGCAKCIQSTVDEVKVDLVGKLGSGILETFTSKGVGLAGGWLKKAKDWIDKGMNAKDIIEALIKSGNLQMIVFEEKMCGYCLFSGIVFYETGTGCVEATFWCKGTALCCNHADMEIIIQYCTDARGYATDKPVVTVIRK